MKERIADINPACEVIDMHMFYTEETYEEFFAQGIDYVIDASDTVMYKIHIMKECLKRNIPIISSMGAANKMDPTRFQIADISKHIQTHWRKSFVQSYVKRAFIRVLRLYFQMKVQLSFVQMLSNM